MPWALGNIIGDGTINEIDLLALRGHFGYPLATRPKIPSTPEPTVLVLLIPVVVKLA